MPIKVMMIRQPAPKNPIKSYPSPLSSGTSFQLASRSGTLLSSSTPTCSPSFCLISHSLNHLHVQLFSRSQCSVPEASYLVESWVCFVLLEWYCAFLPFLFILLFLFTSNYFFYLGKGWIFSFFVHSVFSPGLRTFAFWGPFLLLLFSLS